jgi:ATPase subunit of ABC transporter with duplicated ATPase domains
MARATKAAPAVEETEAPQAHYLDKDPSQTHQNFVDYVSEEVGYDADIKTVQLVIALYQKFQKSPAQQEYNAQRKEESAAAAQAREEKRAEREANKDKAPAAKRASSRRAAAAEAEEDEAPATPRARRGRPAASSNPAPAKRTSGRRRPAASEDELD